MNIKDIRKNTNWVILELFEEIEKLKEEINILKETKANKRKKVIHGPK